MQNYTAIWLDEELGLVLLSLTEGKQRDLACLFSRPWVKSSELHHTSYTAVSGITTSGWHCVCTHAHMCVCGVVGACVHMCICVCVCANPRTCSYIHAWDEMQGLKWIPLWSSLNCISSPKYETRVTPLGLHGQIQRQKKWSRSFLTL